MNAGFVASDKTRAAVFAAVVNGERNLAALAKRHRIIERAAKRAADQLVEAGLLSMGTAGLLTTPAGDDVARQLKRDGSLGGLLA